MFRTVTTKTGVVIRVLDLTYDKFRWRIEHESRGIYTGFDNHLGTGRWSPKFRYSILRDDPQAWFSDDTDRAIEELTRVMAHAPKAYLIKTLRRDG